MNINNPTDTSVLVTRPEWYQNGFKDVDGGNTDDDVEVTFVDGTRTLSVGPKAPLTSIDYYRMGYKYSITTPLTVTLDDEDGLWVFYINSTGLVSLKNPSHDEVDDVIEKTAIVAYVQWDATNNLGKLMWEVHGMNMSPATHHWLHDNIGAVYREGMALSGMTVDTGGDLDSDVQFAVSEGKFYDEDIEHLVTAITAGDNYDVWYLDGTDWRWTNTDVPGKPISAGNRAAWNDAGTQTEVDNNDFYLAHIFATSIMPNAGGTTREYIFIQGQGEYNTKGQARAGADVEINNLVYGTLPLEEVVPVATIILQTSGGHDNSIKSRVISTDSGDDFVDWRGSDLKASGGSISDHGSLAGLSDDDHPQYLLADGTRAMTADLDTGGFDIVNETKVTHATILHPFTAYGIDTQIPLFRAKEDLTVTKIDVSLDATGNQVAGDLKQASDLTSYTSAAVINDFDTTSGVRVDTTITTGAVAQGQWVYLDFDSEPSTDITYMCINIHWDYD